MLASTWERLSAVLCQKTKDNWRSALVLAAPGISRSQMPTLIYMSTRWREGVWINERIEGENRDSEQSRHHVIVFTTHLRLTDKKNARACGQREIYVDE